MNQQKQIEGTSNGAVNEKSVVQVIGSFKIAYKTNIYKAPKREFLL